MPIPDVIIKRVEFLAAWECRYGISGGWILRNRNHEIFSEGTEWDDEEPLIEKEVVHPDIPSNIPEVELEREQNVSAIKKADTDNQ